MAKSTLQRLSDRLDRLEETVESVVVQLSGGTEAAVEEPPKKRSKKGTGSKKGSRKGSSSKKGSKKGSSAKKGSAATPEAAQPVGSSGVRRVPTTRAARDAG